MSVHLPRAALARDAQVVPAPVRIAAPRHGTRPFDLHPALHMMVIGAWFAFIGILVAAFMGEGLVLPAAIFLVGVAALFVTPGLWARVAADDGLRKQSWSEFLEEGVDCQTGHLTAGEAMAQMLVLPGLICALAIFFAVLKQTL